MLQAILYWIYSIKALEDIKRGNVALLFNKKTQWHEYVRLFPYVVHPIRFMKLYEFIHYSYWWWNYYHCPVRLATHTINIMKSQFALGIAAAVKSGHN